MNSKTRLLLHHPKPTTRHLNRVYFCEVPNRLRLWPMEPAALSLTDLLHPDLGNWSDHSEEDEMEEVDELLLLASQQCESALPTPATASVSAAPAPNDFDQIFLAASQQFEQAESENAAPRSKKGRFGDPVTYVCVEQSRKSGIPPKTCQQTSWALTRLGSVGKAEE